MATSKVNFFNPTISDLPAWVNDGEWLAQTEELGTNRERAQALGATGNEAASDLYGEKKTRTLTMKCCKATGNLTLPAIGSLIDASGKAWHIDSFTLEKSPTDWPTLTLQLHAHSNKAHTPCRTFIPSLVIPAGRGIAQKIDGFEIKDLGIAFASFSYQCQTNHLDVADGMGEFLAADNYDGNEQVSLSTTGVGPVIVPEGWDETDSSESRANTSSDSTSHTYVHHVAMAGSTSGSSGTETGTAG